MSVNGNRPKVFISYSRKDETSLAHLLEHLKVLKQLGLLVTWHDGEIGVGDDWYQKIEQALNTCAVAILLVSPSFLGSDFCMREEVPVFLERRRRQGLKIVPILVRHCSLRRQNWLNAMQMRPNAKTSMAALAKAKRDKVYATIVDEIDDFLDSDKAIAAVAPKLSVASQATSVRGDGSLSNQIESDGRNDTIDVGLLPKANSEFPPLPDEFNDVTRLPTSGYDVVGRDKELRFLNQAFAGTELNVVSLRAWGGVGKSTLVNKWREYLAVDNYRGAHRIFAWSFYSQGTSERVTSADAFIDKALRFFKDADPTTGSPWAKGERLAGLVGREKSLLILDGMEPLQDEHQGIKDPALARLVECLANDNTGLCVITTRQSVKEFIDFPKTTHEIDLEQLSREAGRALLRIKGLRATDDLLEQASEAFGNHALALNLLASYLKRFADGDVRQALSIPDLPDVSVNAGKHPRRVMAAFADRFGDGPELDLLHVMGLFDGPADGRCIAAIREQPAIPGLTDHLVRDDGGRLTRWFRQALGQEAPASSSAIWERLLLYLRDLGLLAKPSHHAPDELDAHLLVRGQFGEQLRNERNVAWRAGHDRLYAHLRNLPEKHQPDTLAEMIPLFQVISHGCEAGRRREALDEIYFDRIMRGKEDYLTRKLGAFGANLGLVASFFDLPFQQPVAELSESDHASLLRQAASSLRALGRLDEAAKAWETALKLRAQRQEWKEAAIASDNLTDLYLALGRISDARMIGEQGIRYADKSGEDAERRDNRTVLGNVLHQEGALEEAKKMFEDAEAIQQECWPDQPKLHSARGYRYCGLLLTLHMAEEARTRSAYALEIAKGGDGNLLHIAFGHLSFGRAARALGYQEEARIQLVEAVDGLREAGTIHHVPRGLLARAGLFRETNDFDLSRRDLAEAMRIATRCDMEIDRCDAHLEYARLALAEGDPDAALPHFQSADALVTECGYHRRDPEIVDLKKKLGL